MSITTKINLRISRIKEYARCVAYYRDMKKVCEQMKHNITKIINDDEQDNGFACMKSYHTTAPATNMSEIGDNVYNIILHCGWFYKKPCPMGNCPYHEKREQYRRQQQLVEQASINKHCAFKRMFERIK